MLSVSGGECVGINENTESRRKHPGGKTSQAGRGPEAGELTGDADP